ncbi:MAG: hypothetical protein C5B52_11965 [Bacteroidetes bacterium]|nr:MAG: hypothetical protein C5B52_11965 [Bacteroidota bacterium]
MSYKVNPICLKCSPLLALLLIFQSAFAQYDLTPIDQLLQQNQKTIGKNGVALVWKDGKLVYQKVLGEFTLKTPSPVGNSSKWLTAALVMTFVDEGKISLDDKVTKYLPIYGKYMKGYITIRNCLANTSGVQAEPASLLKLVGKRKFETLEEEVNYYAEKREIVTNPGTEFFYSNVGPNIVGRILEVISKKSFDRLMLERIFRPLKMKNSSFSVFDNSAIDPSNGAQCSGIDFINFMTMILNKGTFEGKKILSEKSVAEMATPQFTSLPVKSAPKIAEGWKYGLGEWIEESDSKGNASVISSPSLYGSWPFLDACRGYVCILLLEKETNDEKKDIYVKLREIINQAIPQSCN